MAFRKVFEFKEVTLDYSSNGASTFNLLTDMPGGAMAQRKTHALASSSDGRKTETIPLDGIEGTLYRPEAIPGSSTVLRLFGGVMYVRPIGVYLDGAKGEKWTTKEIALGV